MEQETPLAQISEDQLQGHNAVELWLAHPVTKTYLACLELFEQDLHDDISEVGRHILSCPNDEFIKSIANKVGQEYALKHIIDFYEFMKNFGAIIPPDEDPDAPDNESSLTEEDTEDE